MLAGVGPMLGLTFVAIIYVSRKTNPHCRRTSAGRPIHSHPGMTCACWQLMDANCSIGNAF